MDRAELFRHHQRVAVIEPLAAELDGLVEAEKAEAAELLEQLMRRELFGLLPFIDEGIDFRRDEFLQRAAGVFVFCGEEHFLIPSSFRGDAKRRTRNLDIALSHLAAIPGSRSRAPRNDGVQIHNPICLDARSFMISSLPPPMALTLTSR